MSDESIGIASAVAMASEPRKITASNRTVAGVAWQPPAILSRSLPSSLGALSSCLRAVSAGADSLVATTVRTATAVAAAINPRDEEKEQVRTEGQD